METSLTLAPAARMSTVEPRTAAVLVDPDRAGCAWYVVPVPGIPRSQRLPHAA